MVLRLRRLLFRFVVLLLILVLLFLGFRYEYQEPIRDLAETLIKNVTSDLINQAVDEQIKSGAVRYDRMVYFEKDLNGRITALKTNMSEVNRLKTEILSLINEKMLAVGSDQLGIPLGSLVIPELFSGKGPDIPVHILAIRNSDGVFFSRFSEAGINQTLQTLTMQITIDISVLVLGKTDHFTVTGQVVVAETVIVGQVPETFLQYGGRNGYQKKNGGIDRNTE